MVQNATTGALPAVVTIPDLPIGTTITGVEIIEAVQTSGGVGNSIQVPISQIMTTSLGALPTGGGTGQILNKTNAANFSAQWSGITQFVAVGTGLATSGSATSIVLSFASQTSISLLGVAGAAAAVPLAIGPGTGAQVLRVNDAGNALAFGQVELASAAAVTGVLPGANMSAVNLAALGAGGVQGVLPVPSGGTNTTTMTAWGAVYANNTSSLGATAAGTTGWPLLGNGTSLAPSFQQLNLASVGFTGVLPYANGGSNASTAWTQGSVIFAGTTTLAQSNTKFFWNNASSFLGIGGNFSTGALPDAPVSVNINATTLRTAPSGCSFGHFQGLDNQSDQLYLSSFGLVPASHNAVSHLLLGASRGTAGGPSPVGTVIDLSPNWQTTLGDYLGFIGGGGYDGASTIFAASIAFRPATTFNATTHGAGIMFGVTGTASGDTGAFRFYMHPQGNFIVNQNAASSPAPLFAGNTGIQLVSLDGTRIVLEMDSFGSANNLVGRRSGGTAGNPFVAVAANQTIWSLFAQSTNAASFQTNAQMQMNTDETQNATTASSYFNFQAVAKATTTLADVARLYGSGNLSIGTTTEVGAGQLVATGKGNFLTGTALSSTATATLLFGSIASFGIYIGTGVPAVNAGTGSLFLRNDGSTATTRMYVNTNGTGTWTGVNTVA